MLHPSAVVSPGQQDWTDLVRADRLKAQDGHPLELLKRIKGRLDGAVPARKVEGQDTTAGPASAEQDFAGEEPEAVVEDLAGGEPGPSTEDSPDGLAEQGATRGLEHQVKQLISFNRSFQDSLWRKAPSLGSARTARCKLSRDDALKSKCCRTVQRGSSIRCTV